MRSRSTILVRFFPSSQVKTDCVGGHKIFFCRKDEEPVKVGDFEAKLDPVLTKMEQDLAKIKEENPENWFEDVYRMYKDRTNWFNYTDTYSNLIING